MLNNLKNFFFKRKKNNTKKIKDTLNNIIKISYSDFFYKKFNIPNVFHIRYEIILILIFLLYLRLKNEKVNKKKMQIMYNYLFEYIDFSLREIGTGDLSVGKKVKNLAKIFSHRIKLYENEVSKDFKNIKKPIKSFIFKNKVKKDNLDNFCAYIVKQHKKLNISTSKEIFSKNFFREPL
tara:strand:- start:445 stop:981 length:537 start_codon:yes stop_codon:yes gene_type:complete